MTEAEKLAKLEELKAALAAHEAGTPPSAHLIHLIKDAAAVWGT